MSKTIFIDTGAWYSVADQSDQYHKQAVDIYSEVLKIHNYLTTTNLVIAETYTLIHRALGYQAAFTFLERLSASPRIVKIYSDPRIEDAAEKILKKYNDQDFSYTDAVSFAVMQHSKIEEAFAFDNHFLIAGYRLIP